MNARLSDLNGPASKNPWVLNASGPGDVDGDCNGDCGAGGGACDGDCAG